MTWRDMAVLDFAFVQERFDEELARMDTISAAVAWPVGVLTALGGLMVGMAGNYTYEPGWLTRLFLGCVAVHAITSIVAIVHFARAYHGASYAVAPFLGELVLVRERIRALVLANGGNEAAAVRELTLQWQEGLAAAADANARNNIRRMKSLQRANSLLLCVLVTTAAAALPYAAMKGRNSLMSTTDKPRPPDAPASAETPVAEDDALPPTDADRPWKSKIPKIEFELRHWWEEPKPPGKRKVL